MKHVDILVTRTFPYPVDVAYAWLTDYQDDDPQRTNAIVTRRTVVKRGEREVEMDVELITLGRAMKGSATVHLFPEERRWQAVAAKGRFVYDYRLSPTPDGARLDVRYRVATRRFARWLTLTLAKPAIKREVHRMWDGFADAMRRELGEPGRASVAPAR